MWENIIPRHWATCELLCKGFSGKEIAHELNFSPRTVKNYISESARACGIPANNTRHIHIQLAILLTQDSLDTRARRDYQNYIDNARHEDVLHLYRQHPPVCASM